MHAGHTLVVRPDGLGDVVLAGPAVRAVAAGSSRVTLLAGPDGAEAGALLPGVDEVVVHELPWIAAHPRPVPAGLAVHLARRLAALGADRALVLTSFHQSALPTALVLRMAGMPWVGAISVDYPGALLDLRCPDPGDVHETLRGLTLAAAAGFWLPAGDDGAPRLRRPAAGPPAPVAGPYVVVHPGGAAPARRWPAGHCAAAAGLLAAAGRTVVVTGGADERALTARVAGVHGVDLGGRTDLAGLARVLAGADAVVAGNTGAAHVAAALGTPVVSLFSPVVPAGRWAPRGAPRVVLGDQRAACAGSRARDCPVPGHPCLTGVPPGDVVRAVDALTRSRPSARRAVHALEEP